MHEGADHLDRLADEKVEMQPLMDISRQDVTRRVLLSQNTFALLRGRAVVAPGPAVGLGVAGAEEAVAVNLDAVSCLALGTVANFRTDSELELDASGSQSLGASA